MTREMRNWKNRNKQNGGGEERKRIPRGGKEKNMKLWEGESKETEGTGKVVVGRT
jgi:hypothetical protein